MIVITGGNGQLGRVIAYTLLRTVGPGGFRLSVRDVTKGREFAELGVEVRAGDFDQPDTLAQSFAGVSQLVLVSTNGPDADRLRQHRVALDAAKRAGVAHVVYTSYVPVARGHDLLHAAAHADTESYLRNLGCAFTILRNNYYAEMFLMYASHAAQTGVIQLPRGAGKAAMISRTDVATAIVAALSPTIARNQILELTGPLAYGFVDLAAVISNVTGQRVVYQNSDDTSAAAWLAAGKVVPPAIVPFVLQATRELAAGHFATVTNHFATLVGHPAEAAPALWTRALTAAH